MDEIGIFTVLRPQPGPVEVSAARDRLAAAITGAPGRRRVSRRTRCALAGGLVAAAAAAAISVPAALPSGGGGVFTGTAWAVDNQPNGTVTISLYREFSDPVGLERALRADGITAYVRSVPMFMIRSVLYPACYYNVENDMILDSRAVVSTASANALGQVSWTVRPSAMPKGSALFLFGTFDKAGVAVVFGPPVVLRTSRAPVCVPAHSHR